MLCIRLVLPENRKINAPASAPATFNNTPTQQTKITPPAVAAGCMLGSKTEISFSRR